MVGYFNKNYVYPEIFPRKIGSKIADASSVREDSDYDDEYIVKPEDTLKQIETAKELLKLVEEYIDKY